MSQADPHMDGIARRRSTSSTAAADRLSIWVILFLIGLVFPLIILLGPLRLTPYRIVLLICLVPCLIRWLSGGAGPIRLADVCIILIALWGALSWIFLHGTKYVVQTGGIEVVETLGAYFLGRCFIRGPEAFRRMSVLLFWFVIALLPFLIYEILTGRSLTLEFISSLGQTYAQYDGDPRRGFERAQGPFQHPILLGVFCGATVSLAYYVVAHDRRRVLRALAVVFAASCAFSSGPLAGISVQIMLIGWEKVFQRFRHRWWALGGLLALGYVIVDLISSRSPLVVLMSYFAFNTATAVGRIQLFGFGWTDVMKHPVFGNVLGYWERPWWLDSDSVDMFWLAVTMAHGLPMGALYLLAFFLIFVAVARRGLSDPRLRDYRMGVLGSMAGMFVAGWGVHFWNETYVLLMFLMGSGVWLLDHNETAPALPLSSRLARRRTVLG